MKKPLLILLLSSVLLAANAINLSSPSKNLSLTFDIDKEGKPFYSLKFKDKPVAEQSFLGFKFSDDKDYSKGFIVVNEETTSFSEKWTPVWGEVDTIVDRHNELKVLLKHEATNTFMVIRFRVFDDCAAFRYEFDKDTNHAYIKVEDELSEFNMAGDHKTFWIPGNPDSNEYRYATTKLSGIDASKADGSGIGTHMAVAGNCIQSPVMMKSDDGLYINIFEAALSDYPAMLLTIDKNRLCLTSKLANGAVKGVAAFLQTPCKTPWRTIIVSDKATDILASKSILNLNEPCKIENTEFIKPFKMVGVWWEMHIPEHSTWSYSDEWNLKLAGTDWNALKPNGRHGANTENVKRYIDFAAENGIDAVLVEGWNIGWEDWAGNWKEEVFDFVTPYKDFDVQEITSYATSKGVKMIMHNETSSSATNYERRIDSAIDFMKKWGYPCVKTGYVGWIIPRGETHDGQWMVQHYERVVKKMADAGIMIDEHEAVRPTGQNRTYPNLMACESARGNEYNAWSVGNLPEHETILPFTRLMGGPMDYTPGIFKIKMSEYQEGNTNQVHTTLTKQLALYVTMFSPIQMAADLPENYKEHMDAFQFIKDVAVNWDDTKVLEAEPGDYITIARKAKGSDNWFIGSITDEEKRETEIKLDFLDAKKRYVATIYADAKDADWYLNPTAYTISKKIVKKDSKLKLKLAAGGGCAISIMPAE